MNPSPRVGEVIRTVIEICAPANSTNIHTERMHDGLRNKLASRALQNISTEEITEPIVCEIRNTIHCYRGRPEMNVAAAIEFLETVPVASLAPGPIGRLGKTVVRNLRALLPTQKSMPSAAGKTAGEKSREASPKEETAPGAA